MIGRYRLGTIFSCPSKQYLIFSLLASDLSTAKNGTWVRNEVRDREFQTTLSYLVVRARLDSNLNNESLSTFGIACVSCNPGLICPPLFCFEADSIWCDNRSEVINIHSIFLFPFVKDAWSICHFGQIVKKMPHPKQILGKLFFYLGKNVYLCIQLDVSSNTFTWFNFAHKTRTKFRASFLVLWIRVFER